MLDELELELPSTAPAAAADSGAVPVIQAAADAATNEAGEHVLAESIDPASDVNLQRAAADMLVDSPADVVSVAPNARHGAASDEHTAMEVDQEQGQQRESGEAAPVAAPVSADAPPPSATFAPASSSTPAAIALPTLQIRSSTPQVSDQEGTRTPSGVAPAATLLVPPPPTAQPSLSSGSTSAAGSSIASGPASVSPSRVPFIDPNYVDEFLPALPDDFLRNRFGNAPVGSRQARGRPASKTGQQWPPVIDMHKLYVRAQHMGAGNFLGRGKRVHNVLMSQDWETAFEEARSLRVFERIEQLKQEHKWSFRQVRKQKTGVVPKAHWDFVLDEMVRCRSPALFLPHELTRRNTCAQRWMQTDVREERRWKVVAAHNLARAAKSWHKARDDPERRAALCIKTRIPEPRDFEAEAAAAAEAEAQAAAERPAEQEDAMAVEEEPTVIAESPNASRTEEKGKAPVKREDGDADAEGEADDVDAEGEAESTAQSSRRPSTGPATKEAPTPVAGTSAAASANPDSAAAQQRGNASQQTTQQQQQQAALARALQWQNKYHRNLSLRAPIFDLGYDDLTIDPSTLFASDEPPETSLTELFGELPPYNWTQWSGPGSDAKLEPKGERRSDEASSWYTKIAPVTKLMGQRPLLVSTVQPARHLKSHDDWGNMADISLEEQVFERDLPPSNSYLFVGRKPREPAPTQSVVPSPPPNAPARASLLVWSSDEDALLEKLAQRFAQNWHMVADVFNSSTTRPPSDQRTAWDMYERWQKLYGTQPAEASTSEATPAPAPKPHSGGQFANFEGSKKRLRRLSIYEAMKKAQKKREFTAQTKSSGGPPRRISMAMHETHNVARVLASPMEMSRYADRERIHRAQAIAMAQGKIPMPGRYPVQQQSGFPPVPRAGANTPHQMQQRLSNGASPAPGGSGTPAPVPSPQIPAQLSREQLAAFQARQQQVRPIIACRPEIVVLTRPQLREQLIAAQQQQQQQQQRPGTPVAASPQQ